MQRASSPILDVFSIAARRAQSRRMTDLAERLAHWWLKEFLDLFPQRFAEWLMGRNRSVLLLAIEENAVSVQLLIGTRQQRASTRISMDCISRAAIDAFLKSKGLKRTETDIGVQLPLEQFFGRSIILPREAGRSLDEVVLRDLATKTPFHLEDIYHDYSSDHLSSEGKIRVVQWVIRKDFVRNAVGSLGLDPDEVNFIEGRLDGRSGLSTPPLISMKRAKEDQRFWLRKATIALTLITALLAAAAAVSKYSRQQALIDGLEAEITTAKSKAQQVRAATDTLEREQSTYSRLRSRKAEAPTLLGVWDEATHILPAHSWITELRFSEVPQKQEQQIVLIGFSAAASSLVGLFIQSPLFFDAALTAPIAMDPAEGRERFVLQAKVKQGRRASNP